MRLRNKKIQAQGFSLIELMIAVAIVGILAAIAYPSYQQYIQSTWRSSAQLCLLEMAQTMEQRYAVNLRYNFVDNDGNGVDDIFVSACTREAGMNNRYNFLGVTSNAVGLQAVPIGLQQSDQCQTQMINQLGVKTVSSATLTADDCW